MLNFPNQSRVYDATRRAVRFWGHDSAMEASFFVNEDALKCIQPGTRVDEASLLSALDLNRLTDLRSRDQGLWAWSQRFFMTYCPATFECVDANGTCVE